MTYTECARITTGHYRVRATSDEVKQLADGKWQLLDPTGEEVAILADKKQAVDFSKKRPRTPSLGRSVTMPPVQPRTFEELAQVLAAIRPPADGHHYIVIEVADGLLHG